MKKIKSLSYIAISILCADATANYFNHDLGARVLCPTEIYCADPTDVWSCKPTTDPYAYWITNGSSGTLQATYTFYAAQTLKQSKSYPRRTYCHYEYNPNPGNSLDNKMKMIYGGPSTNFMASFEQNSNWVPGSPNTTTEAVCHSDDPAKCPFNEPPEILLVTQGPKSGGGWSFTLKVDIKGVYTKERIFNLVLDNAAVSFACAGSLECEMKVFASTNQNDYYEAGSVKFIPGHRMAITRVIQTPGSTYMIAKHPTLNTIIVTKTDPYIP